MSEGMNIRRSGRMRELTRHESVAEQNQPLESNEKEKMALQENISHQENKIKNNNEDNEIKRESEIVVKIKSKKDDEAPKSIRDRRRKSSEGLKSSSDGTRRASLSRPQIKIPYLAQIERRISMDILDYSGKLEGIKLIRELNRETTHYRHLAVALGGSSDCEQLREDLKKSRQRAGDLLRQAKNKLIPCLQEPNRFSASDRKEARRLCKLLYYCIRVLEQEIIRTLALESSFTLQTGNLSLINTGVNEYLTSTKCSPPAQGIDQIHRDRILSEKNEVVALQKEASEVRSYLHKNGGSPSVKSWTMEDFGDRQFLQTILEDSDPSSVSSPASPFPHPETGVLDQETSIENFRGKLHHRRCLCWIFATLLTLILVASLMGTLIAFLVS